MYKRSILTLAAPANSPWYTLKAGEDCTVNESKLISALQIRRSEKLRWASIGSATVCQCYGLRGILSYLKVHPCYSQATIKEECAHITVITIAHRISSILGADRILIMDRGQLAEEGNPTVLQDRGDSLLSAMVKASGHDQS